MKYIMKSRLYRLGVLAAAAVAMASCAWLPASYDAEKIYKITVLHTNDHHGRFWSNRHGEYGLAARKTLIDQIRQEVTAEGGHVLLLSGGDINTGVPESDLQDAEPDFKGMARLGYDAMALGNHEFDNPLAVLRKQQSWVDFPFLSANIYDQQGKRLFPAYTIFNLDGLKVAVLGLTTEDTAKLGNPEFIDEIDFRNPITEASQLVPELKHQAQMVIAVTHMGHYPNAKHGINAPGDVSLARQVNGLDVIVGGHSQDPLFKPDKQNNTLILQAYEWGKYVGRADFEFKNGELTLTNYQLIPVNLKKKVKQGDKEERVLMGKAIAEDREIKAFLAPYQEKGQAGLSKEVASLDGKLEGDRHVVRFQPTNLGELIAQAQQEKMHADLAVMNSGGIRDSIEPGSVTYKDILQVQPFGNIVVKVDLTGKELLNYLRVVAAKPADSGAFAQFSGVNLLIKQGRLIKATINDKPINPAKNYRLAINSYIAAGGDGYPKLDNHPNYVNSGFVDADVLTEYMSKNSPIKIADYQAEKKVIRK
ncbi:bifunctional UDP-sugar hydrolase/5'-nucleotidase UshA [Spartinivicinus ruber]|uniref:bifunctional UDP-sugar hydrolase/5'-nucleotidase UshA n=1 Tax=Spartinivicinus ruber TaxID=2683272 RepID=UPI001E30D767|nr:bifunctional UDP-sugar hydrolase/5'-nucleotidase UshA [Spartinivicinus ruber]